MTRIGDALLKVSRAWRINYSLLGNGDPTLHAHIQPRYLSEDEALRRGPVDKYDPERIASVPFDLERDRPLMIDIRHELERTGVCEGYNNRPITVVIVLSQAHRQRRSRYGLPHLRLVARRA